MPELSTVLGDTSWKVRSDGKSRETDDRLKDGAVNIAEMSGFVGDGATDDIISVKAAIAKALSEGKGAVIRPAGCSIAISEAVFLGFAADQTNPSFSLALLTPGPSGNHESQGGAWKPLTNDFTAIKVGPGQHMRVIGQSVQWTAPPYRGLQDTDCISYAVAAESGGCSGFAFIDCHSLGGYTIFSVGGFGAGALADSGKFDSCSGEGAVYGYNFENSQAYIQTIINNRVNARDIVRAALGHNINIFGGNYSGVSSRAAQFTISNVSSVTATASGNGFTYSFTAEVVSPDADLEAGGVYQDAVIDDSRFGLIPLTITAYNAGTNVISLTTRSGWSLFYGQGTNLKTGSNLETRIQAATTLGVGERLTTFTGVSINQSGTIHLENASGFTRFLDMSAGFDGGSQVCSFENIHANYDVALPADGDATKQTIKQKLQRSHPFLSISQGNALSFNGVRLSQTAAGGASLVIETNGGQALSINNPITWLAPNVRCYPGQDAMTNLYGGPSSALGDGVWNPTPFTPVTSPSSSDVALRKTGWNRTEHWGFLPAFDKTPRLTPSQYTTLTGTLPTFTTGSSISYPLIAGGQNYSIGTPVETDSNDLLVKSKHKFYSYGQDLTTTNITNLAWSFYGKTRKLVVNVEAFERLFPGLGLTLAHASIASGVAFECVITAVNKVDLYVEVSAVSGWILPGTANTQYTGTTIGQSAYAFKKLTGA